MSARARAGWSRGSLWRKMAAPSRARRAMSLEAFLEQLVGPVVLAELLIHAPERDVQRRLRLRLGGQRRRFLGAAVQQGDDAQIRSGTRGVLAAFEESEHERLHVLGAPGLGDGSIARPRQTNGEQDAQPDGERQRRAREANAAPVARQELAQPVADG